MGCFSFKCQECNEPVLSSSFDGEEVTLYLLENGKVIDLMSGQYDSYGHCFIPDTQRDDVEHKLPRSYEWCFEREAREQGLNVHTKGWHKVCDLMHSKDISCGIAAIHKRCDRGNIPTMKSEDDPDQGWGEEWEFFGNTSSDNVYEQHQATLPPWDECQERLKMNLLHDEALEENWRWEQGQSDRDRWKRLNELLIEGKEYDEAKEILIKEGLM